MNVLCRIRYKWRPTICQPLFFAADKQQIHQSFAKLDRVPARPPSNPEQSAEPKAPVQSKIWAFVIGAGAAFAYAAYRRSQGQQSQTTSADGFTTYTLVNKEAISSTCSIFTISPLTGQKSAIREVDHPRSVLSIQIKQPQLQIARSYTLLPPITEQADDTIKLLIRREAKGEVSGYLHDIPIGSDIEVRGPHEDLTFPSDTNEVIFLAGGTGIAPALKTADILKESANVHVVWANRKREDCAGGLSDTASENTVSGAVYALYAGTKALLGYKEDSKGQLQGGKSTLVQLLDILKIQSQRTHAGGKLTVDYYVDDEQTQIRPSHIARLIRSLPPADTANPSTKLIIVSGPDGFINQWAGSREWVNGRQEQGTLGGALAKMDLKGWRVIKL